MFIKEVSSAHQGCIYLIKNTIKTVILWNIITMYNKCFLCEYIVKCNLFLWCKAEFSSLQCHMIFRNHSNMLICCSKNISLYYQCWKQLCCFVFLWKMIYFIFQHSLMNRKYKRTAFIWNSNIFLQWKSHLVWIRREICTDQALFTSQNKLQIIIVFDVWGQQEMDFSLEEVLWILDLMEAIV